MTTYLYSRRPPGSSRSRVPVRAAETSRNLANAISLYQRPILVHSGPTPMRMTESFNLPYPWPWVRLDTSSGVPVRLDEATWWPLRSRGSLDVSMRLVGIYAMVEVAAEPTDDPTTYPTIAPCLIKAELLQYVSGTTPTVLASTEVEQDVVCFPNYVTPWYPLISLLSLGMNQPGQPGYDPQIQNTGSGGLLRVGQLYPPDLPLLQRVRLTVNFEDADWPTSFAAAREYPVFVRVTCIKNPAKAVLWDPNASTNPEYVRIFCVGSEMRVRGRI